MDWVLTAISKDRAGIIEDLAGVISKHDGNWVKSSLSRLGGEFAGIVQVSFAEYAPDDFEQDITELSNKGIRVSIHQINPHDKPEPGSNGNGAIIELTGIDHKGIVLEITQMLAKKNVTIEQFETGVFTSSMAGEPMFFAIGKIYLPKSLSVSDLRDTAESIAQDIMVDINLEITEGDQ